jgi:ribosome-associated protein
MGRQADGDRFPDHGTGREERPSKSARKRAATAAQELGERLVGLSESELAALPLPQALQDVIRAARGMRGRGSRARIRQYIGRLMRDADIAPILRELEAAVPDRRRRDRK